MFFNSRQETTLAITPITQEIGGELLPSASDDGRYLIYRSKNLQNPSNLFMLDRLRTELPAKQLTFDSLTQGKAVWAADGNHIYFPQTDKARTQCQIIRLNVKTLKTKNIISCLTGKRYNYLDISPDGNILAFSGKFQPDVLGGIYFLDLSKSDASPTRFSCSNNCDHVDRDMAFSPDGRNIAVTRMHNLLNENIYLVDIVTKKALKLTEGFRDIVGLTWKPECSKIIFGSRPTDLHGGYVISLNSNEVSPLNIEGFSFPYISKKSGELFYQDKRDSYQIVSYVISESATDAPSPIAQSRLSNRQAEYSPVSGKLAYISNQSGNYELWSSDSSGWNAVKLTSLNKYARYPSWSNDGKNIAFVAAEKESAEQAIYVFNIYSRKTKKSRTLLALLESLVGVMTMRKLWRQ